MDRICSSSLRGVMVLMVDGPIVAGMEAPERTTGWCSFIMCLYFGLDSSVGSFVVVMELQNRLLFPPSGGAMAPCGLFLRSATAYIYHAFIPLILLI